MWFSGFSAWSGVDPSDPDGSQRRALPRRVLQMISRFVVSGNDFPSLREISALTRAIDELPPNRMVRALRLLLRSIADSQTAISSALLGFGHVLEDEGAYSHAGNVYELAADLGTRVHDPWIEANALHYLGRCRRYENRTVSADHIGRRALAIAQRRLSHGELALMAEISLANLTVHREQYREARKLFDELVEKALAAGCRRPLAFALHDLGAVALHDGDYNLAFDCLTETQHFEIEPSHRSRVQHDLGHVARFRGDPDAANDAFTHVRDAVTQADMIWSAHISLLALAADTGDFDECARLVATPPIVPVTDRLKCDYRDTVAYSLVRQGRSTEAIMVYDELSRIAQWCGFATRSNRAARAASGDFS